MYTIKNNLTYKAEKIEEYTYATLEKHRHYDALIKIEEELNQITSGLSVEISISHGYLHGISVDNSCSDKLIHQKINDLVRDALTSA